VAASTGFHKMLFYPSYHWIYRLSAERLARLYLSELEEGMFLDADGESEPQKRCGARAALVKAALDSGPFPGHGQYAKCFEAASLAARTAGCALMVHIEKDSEPLRLAEFLESRGVPAEKTVFCHLDRAVADTGVHKELAARGVFLEYDTICRPRYHGDGREAEIIAELCAAGFSGRLLLSLDTTRSRLAAYGGAPGLCYIIEEFIPRLRRAGVTEAEINRFFVENPARAFTRPPRPPRKAPCAPAPAGPTGSCFADFA
jgi:phosphotriesterase-related protein